MAGLQVQAIECLGTERIRVWRFFRLFRAVRQLWLRLCWRDAVRALFVLQLPVAPPLAVQCARARALHCLTCGLTIPLPRIPPTLLVGTTTFGCAGCHAYYYLTTAPDVVHDPRYAELRATLAERGRA